MGRGARWQASLLIIASAVLAGYTVTFVVVANRALCLFAIAPPLYYLPQRIVAVVSIIIGIMSLVHASRLRRVEAPRSLVAAHVTFAIILLAGAAIRFAYVGLTTAPAICAYLP